MPETISLSLISHTNVGKTALARTLLGRDVGDVRDAPHVTASAAQHAMIESPAGRHPLSVGYAGIRRQRAARAAPRRPRQPDPSLSRHGMGSVARPRILVEPAGGAQRPRRGRRRAVPRQCIGVAGRRRLHRARIEDPGMDRQAGHRAAEPDRPARARRARKPRRLRAGASALGPHPVIDGVLSLDAFARCWIQEGVLLREVAKALPRRKAGRVRAAGGRLACGARGAIPGRDGRDRRTDRARRARARRAARHRIARLSARCRQGDRFCRETRQSREAGGNAHAVRAARCRYSRKHRSPDRHSSPRRPRGRRGDGAAAGGRRDRQPRRRAQGGGGRRLGLRRVDGTCGRSRVRRTHVWRRTARGRCRRRRGRGRSRARLQHRARQARVARSLER